MLENSAPTFTSIGTIITAVGPTASAATDVAIQGEGKILVAGYCDNAELNDYDYAVLRYNSDGSLDTSFGIDGMAITPIGTSDDYAKSIALQPDGKILLAGEIWDGQKWIFALVRYDADGSLDNGFGTRGIVTTPINAAEYGNSIAIQADGKILLAGSSWDGTTWNFVATRYNSDGSLDTNFSDDGTVTINMGPYGSAGYNVLVQADGKILLTGVSDYYGTAVVRLNSDGSLDGSYGSGGEVVTNFQWGISSTLLADGTLLVAGHLQNETMDFAVAKYRSDGSLDTSFGANGIASYDIGGYDIAIGIAVQPDGKILLSGNSDVYVKSGNAIDFALLRLNADGSLDTTFDNDGHLTTAIGAYNDNNTDIAVQDDGKIILVGQSDSKFALARYNPDGSLDATFGAANTLDHSATYTENGAPILLDAKVSIYDAELAALADGAGNYGGATLTLSRSGGSNADDDFSATGNLHFSDGLVLLSGPTVLSRMFITIGTYSESDGTLQITFNQNATQAWVNQTLSSIAYANSSDNPPASVQIEWVFSDCNSGAQGSGGALVATGSTIVNLTPLNDLPQLTGSQAALPNGDIGLTYIVLAQDLLSGYTDIDGDSLMVANLVADYADVVDNGDGSYSITPRSPHYRLIGLHYDVEDSHGGSIAAAQSFSLGILVNTAPSLTGSQGQLASGQEDSFDLLSASSLLKGYSDADGDILGIADLTADYGSVKDNGDGTYTITPTANYSGPISLQYNVIDHNGGSTAGNQTLQVVSTNDVPSFVAGGVAITSFGHYSRSNALAIEPDGQLLLGGMVSAPGAIGVMLRYHADGSLDDSFVNNVASFGENIPIATTIVVQRDDKIIVAGHGPGYATAVRYNPDGTLDKGFGEEGLVSSQAIHGGNVTALLQPDGKILLTGGYGFLETPDSTPYTIVRYNSDGTLDSSFDADGIASTMIGTFGGVENALLQPDGKILLIGSCFYTGSRDFFLIRFNADGSLDSSFSVDGKLTTAIGRMDDLAYDAVLQDDGKIVVVGQSDFDFVLVRYNHDGTLDSGFGMEGKVTADFGAADTAYDVAIQTDGKILVVGNSEHDGNLSLVVLTRYNPDGTLDTGFGNAGTTFVSWEDGSSHASSVSLQPDGKIVVAGSSADNFVLARFNPDGSLDNTLNPFNTLDAVASYTENGAATVLDSCVQIYDAELYQNGSLAGATLTLLRHGGANAEDIFSGSGTLDFVGSNVELQGFAIGSLAGNPGTITITFNDAATPALVNELLSSIAYANTSDFPPASVQIDWIFSDGTGSNTSGHTIVAIAAINEAPELTGSPAALAAGNEDSAYYLTASTLLAGYTDEDGDLLSVANLIADHGSVVDHGNGSYTIMPTTNYNDTVHLSYVVTDGQGGYTQAMQSFTALAVNDAPILSSPIAEVNAPTGLTFSFRIPAGTFTDPDASGSLSYTATMADGSKLPSWISFNAATQTFSGTPDAGDIGTWSVCIAATDSTSTTAVDYFDILVDRLRLHGTASSETLQGTAESDFIFGEGGNDILYGLSGNDQLDGGTGGDAMFGGKGDDSYVVDDAGDTITELSKQGSDSVYSRLSYSLANNLENLTLLGDSDINAYGNKGKNVLSGNSSDNQLDGGADGDTLMGGLGNDSYVVDNKKDVIQESLGEGHDTVNSSITFVLGSNLEDLILTGKAPNGSGNGLDNTITGNGAKNKLDGQDGNDTLFGNESNDALLGGAGNDTLVGGTGNDRLSGGIGSDIFTFNNLSGADTITDFQVGQDLIVLELLTFSGCGTSGTLDSSMFISGAKLNKATDIDDRIIYDSSTGKLYYDADGSGTEFSAMQFVTLTGGAGIALSASDFMLV